jgi:hypothetical protein
MAAMKTQRAGHSQSVARLASVRFSHRELSVLLSILDAWQAGEARQDRSETVTRLKERVRRACARAGQ